MRMSPRADPSKVIPCARCGWLNEPVGEHHCDVCQADFCCCACIDNHTMEGHEFYLARLAGSETGRQA